MDALGRETAATSRIQVAQELNRSSSRGSAVLHKSVRTLLGDCAGCRQQVTYYHTERCVRLAVLASRSTGEFAPYGRSLHAESAPGRSPLAHIRSLGSLPAVRPPPLGNTARWDKERPRDSTVVTAGPVDRCPVEFSLAADRRVMHERGTWVRGGGRRP